MPPKPLSPDPVGAAFFGGVTLFATSLAALSLYETWALATGKRPVTSYTREAIIEHRDFAAAALLAMGVLCGHFWK